MRVRGDHLPGVQDPVATQLVRCGPVDVDVARLSPAELAAAMQHARAAALRYVRPRSVAETLVVLDRVVTNWLNPSYHLRQLAEEILPPVTGFSPEMIRHGLPLLFGSLRAVAVRGLLDTELGNSCILDQVRAGRRAVGPSLITHVMSGNIPGLAAIPMLLSLALKSAALIKPAAGDLVCPALLAASISEVDAELGECVVVAGWRGGDRESEVVAFAHADLVIASGSDAAIAAITSHVPGRFIGHGHKISFAVIGRERLGNADCARQLAQRLAYDVSLWDQQGCLSPQLCYVETGGTVAPADFADLLAQSLARYARELPPRPLTFEEQADVLRFREEAEWSAGPGTLVLASPGSGDWTISLEPDAVFLPSCLHRCIRLKAVETLCALEPALALHRRHLEAAGVAVGESRLGQLSDMLARCGVHRVCPLGAMQLPPLSWRQSGRPRVGDWVEWTTIEGEPET